MAKKLKLSNELLNQLEDNVVSMETIFKAVKKNVKDIRKLVKKKKKKTKNLNSAVHKKRKITKQLHEFLINNTEYKQKELSKAEVLKGVSQYIKKNKLQDSQENKKYFIPNNNLIKLFEMENKPYIFLDLNKFIHKHFI